VSNMPFMALKFNNEFRWSANKSKYLFILIAILLTAIFREEGIAISMVIYITMAFILQCREWLKIN
jgi:CDP-diacylglycerol--serine O-phosphatidyltransferase